MLGLSPQTRPVILVRFGLILGLRVRVNFAPAPPMAECTALFRPARSARTTGWSGRSMVWREVAPLCSLSARQGVDVGGGQRVAADPPVAAFHLLDDAPRDIAHVLALDRDHRVGQLADHLALLFLAEDVLDDANLNERHWIVPFIWVDIACP